MNRKIKSGSVIEKEIKSLFENHKSEDALVLNIKKYLDSITGKELLGIEKIKSCIFSEITDRFFTHGLDLRKNAVIVELFPHVHLIGSLIRSDVNADENDFKKLKIKDDKTNHRNLLVDIISMIDLYNKKDIHSSDVKLHNAYKDLSKQIIEFKKLFVFLEKNPDVSTLLKFYVEDLKKRFVADLVIRKIIPLKSVFIYFDDSSDIKENTETFYLLLKKKIPRSTIQTAIHENLKYIKVGKFSVPEFP